MLPASPRHHPRSLEERLLGTSEPDLNGGCRLWFGRTDRLGYGSLKHRNRLMGAHRASWLTWRGDIPAGLCVCHRCDVRSCVNPDHLFLGTQKENLQDASRKGRTPLGEKQGRSKLKNADVLRIRALARDGQKQRDIAAAFGIGQSTVSEIVAGKKWPHL